ncbi:MAG: hypothetical protein K2K98_07535 [Muribaculaceae bacterium]|nr:hypothetical protein [Muribaculaceae bacterium]
MKTKKKVSRLTESDLHRIVLESVKRVIRESREEITIERIPCWASGYLINGDTTSVDDDEIQEIEDWMRRTRITQVTAPDTNDSNFTKKQHLDCLVM